jgi:Tol biopolymer transport system component
MKGSILAVAIAALVSGAAHATVPGRNGLIVYQSRVGRHIQLFTVRPDGSRVHQLTRFRDSDALNAAWSPDGWRIVFQRDFSNHVGIYTIGFDGRKLTAVTTRGLQGGPAYSPDGRLIVFDRTLSSDDSLWVMAADGTHLRRLTRNSAARENECRCDGSPVFSPDGRQVAFVRTITDLKKAAFVINADGTGLHQVTPWSFGVSDKLDWSPDGSKILISSPQVERANSASNIYTVRPDGTGLRQLTHERRSGVHDLADGFSPDGRWVIFARTVYDGAYQVYVMNANGTGVKQLTHGIDAHWASWGRQP